MLLIIAVVVVGIAVFALGPSRDAASTASGESIFKVARGPLTISVVTSGTFSSSQAVVLKSEVEGRTTILSLVEEGQQVKAGDLLIELESSELEDQQLDQDIIVENARAAHIQAREKVAVVTEEAKVDTDAAQVEYDLAQLDLEKYTGTDGEYRQELDEAESKITIAEAKLERANDKLEWSQRLYKEEFITHAKLKADELEQHEAKIELRLAGGQLRLLRQFTYKRKETELSSAVRQKQFGLAKTRHKATSNIVDAEASLRAKGASLKREEDRLRKIVEQIGKCKIVAPVDGMVVYATSNQPPWRNTEPLTEGLEIRERQELIRLPTTQKMKADVKIHESMLKKVREGQAAHLTTDALPGRSFTGTVKKIALLPDSQSRWLNPDLKVYNCVIDINGDTADLRPGFTCSAELVVEQYEDVVYVPVQAVLRVNGEPTVYVSSGRSGAEPRRVAVGLDNNQMIHVLDGLSTGERVLLAPPLPPSTLRQEAARIERPAEDRSAAPTKDRAAQVRDASQSKTARPQRQRRADRQQPGAGKS